MEISRHKKWHSDRLLFLGVLLFLFGLLIGLFIPMMINPRMGLAAITGAGKMMPIAGGKEAASGVEGFISFLLISLALAMISVCIIVLAGLFRYIKQDAV